MSKRKRKTTSQPNEVLAIPEEQAPKPLAKGESLNGLAEIVDGSWIDDGRQVLLIGQPGRVKTLISGTLVAKATQRGSVKEWECGELCQALAECQEDETIVDFIQEQARVGTLIIHDWGIGCSSLEELNDLLQILYRRCIARFPTALVSQIPFNDWGRLAGDSLAGMHLLGEWSFFSIKIELPPDPKMNPDQNRPEGPAAVQSNSGE